MYSFLPFYRSRTRVLSYSIVIKACICFLVLTSALHASAHPPGFIYRDAQKFNTGDVIEVFSPAAFAANSKTYSINVTPTIPAPVLNYPSAVSILTSGEPITGIAPTSLYVASFDYGTAQYRVGSGMMTGASSMSVAPNGDIYFRDNGGNGVRRVNAADSSITTFYNDGPVQGTAVDASGDVYIRGLSDVFKFTGGSGAPQTLSMRGLTGTGSLGVDGDGNMYVYSLTKKAVYKLPAANTDTIRLATFSDNIAHFTIAPNSDVYVTTYKTVSGVTQYDIHRISASGGSPSLVLAGLSRVSALAVDAAGNLLITDSQAQNLKMYHAGNFTTPTTLYTSSIHTSGVILDAAGNIYTAGQFAGYITKLQPTGGYFAKYLPAGIILNSNTGVIEGTPAIVAAEKQYKVTAWNEAGATSQTVKIKVVAGNANLVSLILSAGTLIPEFNPDVTDYQLKLNHPSAVTITPTAAETGAVITVDGSAVSSGAVSQSVDLPAAETIIQIVVTAAQGQEKTYRITRPALPDYSYAGPNVFKQGLPINLLVPTALNVGSFDYASTQYRVGSGMMTGASSMSVAPNGDIYFNDNGGNGVRRVNAADSSITTFYNDGPVQGTAVDASGDVYIRGLSDVFKFTGGSGAPQTLSMRGLTGTGSLGVDGDGNMYVYSLTKKAVYKLPAANTDTIRLATFSDNIAHFTIAPNSDVYVTTYKTVSGVTQYDIHRISASGGSPSLVLAGLSRVSALAVDAAGNLLITDSQAQDLKMYHAGNFTTPTTLYTSSIHTSGVILDAAGNIYTAGQFAGYITKLQPTGGYFSKYLPVGLTLNSNTGVIEGTPAIVAAEKQYKVTAWNEAGYNEKQVAITVEADILALMGLSVVEKGLSPAFDAGIFNYTLLVNSDTTVLHISATAEPSINITINGANVSSGLETEVPLVTGDNLISVRIANAVGDTVTYNITATRAPSTNANLTGLVIEDHANITLTPAFSPTETAYTATTNGPVSYVYVTPGSDPGQQVYVNDEYIGCGCSSSAVEVFTGANQIVVKVIAEDGVTEKNYNIHVNVPANTNLQSLDIDDYAAFDPDFNPDSTSYAITVRGSKTTIVVYPLSFEPSNLVAVNGVEVPWGDASPEIPLALGANVITVTVTTPDSSSSKTYTLNVNRNGATEAGLLSMTVSHGVLTPAFATADTAYSLNVGPEVDYIGVTPTAIDSNATIYVDDFLTPSGEEGFSYNLYEGENTVIVDVIASDGVTSKTYVLTVNKAAPVFPDVNYNSGYTFTKDVPITPVAPVSANVDPITAGYLLPTTLNSDLSGAVNVVLDKDENAYVVTQNANPGLYKVPYGGGTPQLIVGGYTGLYGLAINPAGDVFMADAFGGETTLFKVAAGTTTAMPIGHSVSKPVGLALDTAGNIYVAEQESGKIKRLLAGDGYSTVEEIATGFTSVFGLALDRDNNVYLTETQSGNLIKLLAAENYQVADTLAVELQYPLAIKADPIGNLFVADAGTQRLTKIPAGGGSPVVIAENVGLATGITLSREGYLYFTSMAGTLSVTAALGGYYIDKPLPAGLNFNDTTGVISGTPRSISPVTSYLVTANNSIGTGSAEFDIEVAAGNAVLDSLVVSAGSLSPAFNQSQFEYTAIVDSAEANINVTPYANDAAASIKVNGSDVPSGAPSQDIGLNYGDNTINVVVTSENGLTTKTYTITVNRGAAPPVLSYSGPQVYVTNNTITPLTPTGSNISSPGFSCQPDSLTSDIVYPYALTADGQGNLYTQSFDGGLIFKIDKNGTSSLYNSDFEAQASLASDGAGNLYVAHYNNTSIAKIPAGGGPAQILASGLQAPSAIAADNYGNLYVADSEIKKINAVTGDVVSLGGDFYHAIAMAVDGSRNIYIATVDGELKKLLAADNYHTSILLADDLGVPGGITVDGANNVFVTSLDYGEITKVTASGQAETFSYCAFSPGGIAFNNQGKLFISELVINSISYFNPVGGYYISPALPAGLAINDTTGVISGTPALATPARDYTVTTYNRFGSGQAAVNITVVESMADLSNLTISRGTLSPVFSSADTSYTVAVLNTTTALSVTPTAALPASAITINGSQVTSGEPEEIPLNIGNNTVSIIVTAEDGVTTKTYTVVITRKPSTNALLSQLELDQGITKKKVNGPNYRDYKATAYTNAVSIAASAQDSGATIYINGELVPSGGQSQPITLTIGANTINTVVTAADGVTSNTYSIVVTRKLSDNALLSQLDLDQGITKKKVSGINYRDYTALAYTNAVRVLASAHDPGAIIRINGELVTSGEYSSPIMLNNGANNVNVVVTAADGITINTYSIVVTRKLSDNALLSQLELDQGITKKKVKGSNFRDYTASTYATTVRVTASVHDAGATIRINGEEVASGGQSQPITLNPGANIINTVVTAADGITTNTYSIVVTRRASANTNLAGLTLTPEFTVSTQSGNYVAAVNAETAVVKVHPLAEDPNAAIVVNNMPLIDGYSPDISLEAGENNLTVTVTAQNGASKNYQLIITRPGAMRMQMNTAAPMQNTLPEVTVNSALSPNGDGINDQLIVNGIEAYPANSLTIMNSKGVQVIYISGYDNQAKVFDGRNRAGALQPQGTYFYLLEYKAGSETKRKSGYIILKY
ncbi:cadherin-like beta sandwich domain-containing protein [Mucilaginibacter hurinus]|nr:cadherin-like beta sandwich domain-containing protein [Mucilaginibacter hurinus]